MTRTHYLLIPALAVAATVLAGCSSDPEPAAAPSPSTAVTSASPSSSPSPAADAYAQQACQKNTTAQTGETDLKLFAEVASEAQQSSSEPIVRAGALLDEHVKLAEAAQGAEDQVRMEAGLIASSFRFTAACAGVGLAY